MSKRGYFEEKLHKEIQSIVQEIISLIPGEVVIDGSLACVDEHGKIYWKCMCSKALEYVPLRRWNKYCPNCQSTIIWKTKENK